jgi:hypothetical protein
MSAIKCVTLAVLASVVGCAAPQYRVEIQTPIQRPEMTSMTIIIQK